MSIDPIALASQLINCPSITPARGEVFDVLSDALDQLGFTVHRFVLGEPEVSVWDFDVYVEPRLRLGRTMARLWDEAYRRWYAQGVRWSFSRISAFNSRSMLSHARMGAHRIGMATFLSAGNWQISISSIAPRLHFSTHARSFPEFSLRPLRDHDDDAAR